MNVNLKYTTAGEGEPLVLLMGLGADGGLWEKHVEAYSRHFRCIMVDNRGAGRSPRPGGAYTTEMMARDTLGLMDELGIPSASFAGISMGSAIAQTVALLAPDRVRKLALVSSWARSDQYMKDVFEHFARIRPLVAAEHFMQLLQLWVFSPNYFNPRFGDMLGGRIEARFNPMPDHAFAAQCAACINHNVFDRLGDISVPCLLTAGDADIFTPLRYSEEMHKLLPDYRLVVFPGLGHGHHWEDLARFNEVTVDFLLAK